MNKIIKTDVIKGLSQLQDNSQDLIILDSPYNIGKAFNTKAFKMDINNYNKWLKEIVEISLSKLKTGGVIYMDSQKE